MIRKVGIRSRFVFEGYSVVFDCDSEEYEVPMNLAPTVSVTRKLNRGVNRLLPVGHRYRGDVGVCN